MKIVEALKCNFLQTLNFYVLCSSEEANSQGKLLLLGLETLKKEQAPFVIS